MVSCGTFWVALYPQGVSSPLRCWLTTKGRGRRACRRISGTTDCAEDVDEIVAAVIASGCRPLAGAAGVVVDILATAAIAAFEIAGRVDDEAGVALAVTHGLCCHAHHFADGRHAGRCKFHAGQSHLLDHPLGVH